MKSFILPSPIPYSGTADGQKSLRLGLGRLSITGYGFATVRHEQRDDFLSCSRELVISEVTTLPDKHYEALALALAQLRVADLQPQNMY